VGYETLKKTTPFQPAKKILSQYLQNVEVNLSPVQILIKTYDLAIFSLKKNDIQVADKAITELILALNFHKSNPQNVKEIAMGFLNIYEHCRFCIRKNNIKEAADILQELRDAWFQSIQSQEQEKLRLLQEQS